METTVKDTLEQLRQDGAVLLQNLEQTAIERKKLGDELALTKEANKKLNDRIDELEIKLQKAAWQAAATPSAKPSRLKEKWGIAQEANSLARKAMIKAIKNSASLVSIDGRPVISDDEYKAWTMQLNQAWRGKDGGIEEKALSIADNTTGGYLTLPPEFIADVIEKVVLISPVRQYANVIETTRTVVERPKRTATLAAVWTTETGTRAESGTGSSLAFGLEQQSTYEMYSLVLLSLQMIEDAAFDMDQYIQKQVAQQFAKAEGTAFVKGSGVGQPEGITVNTAVLANYTPGTDASNVVYKGLVNTMHALPSFYAPNARWAMNRKTVGAVRNILDQNLRPIWTPNFGSFDVQNPATILGAPYFEAPDMQDVASNAFPVVFGDFEQGYTVVDRVQMTVQRLVEKYSDTGQIGIQVRKRVGGQVTNDEAFMLMKIATS